MLSEPRLLINKYVQEKTERAHVKGHKDEAPFHHSWLGVVLELIDRDINCRCYCNHKPRD
ncbi:Uncharacterised protein [Mycobacterium tuberculosis]|nr:Uncharacterised protein [Mycobacterium tuberculosis]